MVRKVVLSILFAGWITNSVMAQISRDLSFYLEKASASSPLLHDLANQKQLSAEEQERLRAQYTRSRVEMNGNYLFVPIINRDKGSTSFAWDAGDATDYYGYDSGVTSGEFRAGVTWTKPLTGGAAYRVARQRSELERERMDEQIQLAQYELTRTVTEQYLLCQSDQIGLAQANSILEILQRQRVLIEKLTKQALAKLTDVNLIDIEIANTQQTASSFKQSYWTHLADLNLLCGLIDTAEVKLEPIRMEGHAYVSESQFLKGFYYDSLCIKNDYRQFSVQYHPQLNLFVDGGLRTTSRFTGFTKHFGASAGVTFTWTLTDGGQKKNKYRQMQYLLNTNEIYKNQQQVMISQKRNACRRQLVEQDTQLNLLKKKISDYEILLQKYQREINAGQLSVLDYITVLKGYVQVKNDYDSQQINRDLIMNALNYWNW